MDINKKIIRKTLENKIIQLNDIIADLDSLLTKMDTDYYRVSVFGSARITPDSPTYQLVHDLAYQLALRGIDIVTGGGQGLMGAANRGAKQAGQKARSIGLAVQLPSEPHPNDHLDVKKQHKRFSSRLDEFMRLSHAIIVTPGGIGTLLELFYTWQLIQVKHVESKPLILLGGGDMWRDLLKWMQTWPLAQKLVSPPDLDLVVCCDSIDEVLAIIEPDILLFNAKSTITT
jgi:uncharacterized protein (TIGR00730 family)